MTPQFIDFDALDKHLTAVCNEYERTAPPVANYANDLYIRLNEKPESVTVVEIQFVAVLLEGGVWMQANYAANRLLHHLKRIGGDTTGLAGF